MKKTNEKNLCVVTGNLIVAKEVFTKGGAEKLLAPLRDKLKEFTPDLSTDKGRKEIASFAAKFSKSKTLVDKLGKELKDEYSVLIKPIDAERKTFRDGCDDLRDKARQPLTEWENEQKRLEEIERQKVIFDLDHEEAIEMDNYFNEKRAFEKEKAEMQRVLAEQEEKARAEQAEKDRLEYEARIKRDAEEKAKREAGEALLLQKQEQERWIIEAKEAQEQARIDAENAEKKRLADIIAENLRVEEARIEAAQRAEHEKAEAIAKVKREHEAKEQAEKEREAKIKAEAERKEAEQKRIDDARKADVEHRAKINNKILKALAPYCIDEKNAKDLIGVILTGGVPNTTINY